VGHTRRLQDANLLQAANVIISHSLTRRTAEDIKKASIPLIQQENVSGMRDICTHHGILFREKN
jgi:hypothetical protein